MLAMPRSARLFLIAVLLALYGSVSLCGTGLHALMEPSPAHHCHDRESEQETKTVQAVSDHCLLCDFQAQGQLAVSLPALVSRPLDQPHLALVLEEVATRDRHPSSSPRAPPLSI
jgi:hypothetical protein